MSQVALTEQQLFQIVHSLYEGNTQYPSASDDDYLVRRDVANGGVLKWDMYKGTLWNELWVPSAGAPGAALTVQSNVVQYALPTDFRFISSYLRLVDSNNISTYYRKIKPESADLMDGKVGNFFYITGNARTGYFINFFPGNASQFPASSDVGKTIKYEYYKRPSLFANSTDIAECSNPDYFIHYILAYLYRQDDNFEAANDEMAMATEILTQMQAINAMSAWREEDRIPDGLFDDREGQGFGR